MAIACCENNTVVNKVDIVRCKRPLGPIRRLGVKIPLLAHIVYTTPEYYVTMQQNPNATVNEKKVFGKMPSGNIVLSPGVNMDDYDATTPTPAIHSEYYDCKTIQVCPSESQRLLQNEAKSGTYFLLNPFSQLFGNCAGHGPKW